MPNGLQWTLHYPDPFEQNLGNANPDKVEVGSEGGGVMVLIPNQSPDNVGQPPPLYKHKCQLISTLLMDGSPALQDMEQRKKHCSWLLVSHEEVDLKQLVCGCMEQFCIQVHSSLVVA